MAYKDCVKKIIGCGAAIPTAAEIRDAQEAFLELALEAHSKWSLAGIRIATKVTSTGFRWTLEVDGNACYDLNILKARYRDIGHGPLSAAGMVDGVCEMWRTSRLSSLPDEALLWLGINRIDVQAITLVALLQLPEVRTAFVNAGGRLTLADYEIARNQKKLVWPHLYGWVD